MNKIILTCIFFLWNMLHINSVFGGQVSEQTAKTIALTFFNAHSSAIPAGTTITAELAYQRTEDDNSVDYFIFNMKPSPGFVIVSGNYNASPVIGYSLESTFAADINQETGISYWMNKSAMKIHHAYLSNLPQDQKISEQWNQYLEKKLSATQGTGIGPLLSTTWNQSRSGNPASAPYYYNLFCPSSGGQNSLAGCNAIAIAQIMNYWKYPTQGMGYNSYTPSGYSTQSVNFGSMVYRWNVMPNAITSTNYNSDGALALDTLIYQCGVAVNMEFSPSNSWSYLYGSPSALNAYTAYFGYDQTSIQYSLDTLITTATWLSIIENELNNARAVQYRGADPVNGGAHIWVCDGYDANDFLHMNWGWGGQDNGFYQVGALSPGGDQFNAGDMALIGIHPPGQTTGPALGIASQSAGVNALRLYPNPSNDLVTIEISSAGQYADCSLTIYDNIGRMVSSRSIEVKDGQNQLQMDVSAMPTGVYTLRISSGAQSSTVKFVKTN